MGRRQTRTAADAATARRRVGGWWGCGWIAVGVLALAGCGGASRSTGSIESRSSSSSPASQESPAAKTERPTLAASPLGGAGPSALKSAGACTRKQIRSAFASFLAAFNRGDYGKLDSLFAAEPAFRWFSSSRPGLRLRRAASRRGTLVGYFRRRHARHERLRLLHLGFPVNAPHRTGFFYELRRSAIDFRHDRWFGISGKGAAVCHGGPAKFIVMSFGGADPQLD